MSLLPLIAQALAKRAYNPADYQNTYAGNPELGVDYTGTYTDPATGNPVSDQLASSHMPMFRDQGGNLTQLPNRMPSFWQQMFNPEQANRLIAQNDQWRMMEPDAEAANTLAQRSALSADKTRYLIGASAFGHLDPAIQAGYGGDAARYTAETGNAPTGTPERFSAEQADAMANAATAKNRMREAAMSGLLGIPEQNAEVSRAANTYNLGEYGGMTALQPSKFYNQGLGQQVQQHSLIGALDSWPSTYETEMANARMGAAHAAMLEHDLPYSLGAEDVALKRGAALAPYGGSYDPMSMYVLRTDPGTGMTVPVPNSNSPYFGHAGSPVSIGGGLNVMPPSGMSPATYPPAQPVGVPAPQQVPATASQPSPAPEEIAPEFKQQVAAEQEQTKSRQRQKLIGQLNDLKAEEQSVLAGMSDNQMYGNPMMPPQAINAPTAMAANRKLVAIRKAEDNLRKLIGQ